MKIFRSLCVSILALVLISSSFICAYAVEKATICGTSVPVGSTVTYSFCVSDAQQKIMGAHLEFYYDRDCLTLESVTDNMKNSTVNEDVNQTGRIIVINSLINGGSGLNCSSKKKLVSITFTVDAPLTSDITYYIPYLYDANLENLNEYTFSADILVDDEVVLEGQTPVLEDVSLRDDVTDVGDFENTTSGKPNSASVPSKPHFGDTLYTNTEPDSDDTQAKTTEPNSEQVTSTTTEVTELPSETVTEETDAGKEKNEETNRDKDSDEEKDESGFSGSTLLIVFLSLLVVILVVGCVILTVYIIRKNKN